MYIIISYDIASPKRLRKVADWCLNYGVRVQLSVYEFRLPAALFEAFWDEITEIANPEEDKIVAYPLHGASARSIRTFGTMVCSDQVVCYLF